MQYNEYQILKLMGDAQQYDAQAQAAAQAANQNGWGGGLGALLGGIGGYMANKRQGQAIEASTESQNALRLMENDRAAWEAEQAQIAANQERQAKLNALIPMVGEKMAYAVVDGGADLKDLKPEQTAAMQNAAAMGLKPGDPEYNAYIEKVTGKGGITVNNQAPPQFGSIEKGYMMKQDEQGNYYQAPIPGSPAEREAKTRESKASMKGLSAFQDANA